jgi:hypothetical protein
MFQAEDRRRLIASRFQEIRVRDYQVVSLYLLTGGVVTPDPLQTIEVDPNGCSRCAGHKKHDEEFCGDCMPMVEHDRDERR